MTSPISNGPSLHVPVYNTENTTQPNERLSAIPNIQLPPPWYIYESSPSRNTTMSSRVRRRPNDDNASLTRHEYPTSIKSDLMTPNAQSVGDYPFTSSSSQQNSRVGSPSNHRPLESEFSSDLESVRAVPQSPVKPAESKILGTHEQAYPFTPDVRPSDAPSAAAAISSVNNLGLDGTFHALNEQSDPPTELSPQQNSRVGSFSNYRPLRTDSSFDLGSTHATDRDSLRSPTGGQVDNEQARDVSPEVRPNDTISTFAISPLINAGPDSIPISEKEITQDSCCCVLQ